MRASTGAAAVLAALGATLIAAPAAHADPTNGSAQHIRNEQTGRCLDSDQDGKVYTKPCTANNSYQQWYTTYLNGTDYYLTIKNTATGMCLTQVSAETVGTMSCSDGYFKPQRWGMFDYGRANQLRIDQSLDSDDRGNVCMKDGTRDNRYQSSIFAFPG
ncbi:RICIN domain-containing protein [Streptomyces sp. NPDC002073]